MSKTKSHSLIGVPERNKREKWSRISIEEKIAKIFLNKN